MGRFSRAAAAAAVATFIATFTACGGSSSPGFRLGEREGGAEPDSASAATEYTLDNACELVAPKVCAVRKPCCEKTHGYDEAGCLAQAKSDCAKDVGDARAGRATFRPERIEPCLATLGRLLETTCHESVELLYRLEDVIGVCNIFEGTLPQGAACERTSQCQPAASPRTFVDCTDATKTCTHTRVLDEGEACRYGEGAGVLCGKDLYCDASIETMSPGVCKKATPIGSPCDATKPIPVECGLGAYCDRATAQCAAAKDVDAPCETALECKSFKCEAAGTSAKVCRHGKPVIAANECKGS